MNQNNKLIFKPDKEQIEKERKEILSEINKTNNEIRRERSKKIWLIFALVLLIVLFIKIVFGTIDIPNIFGYPPSKVRFYKVTVNGEATSVGYELKHEIPIIPYLINFNSRYFGLNYINGDEDVTTYLQNDSEKYVIDIESYSCYSNDYQVECKTDNQIMKKNSDTKYTNLQIVRTNNPYEEIYNGKFVNDITEYVKSKGVYYVGITAKHSLTETNVYFYFER